MLQTFNELRIIAPLSLFSRVAESIRESLSKIGLFCDHFYKKEKTNFDKEAFALSVSLFNEKGLHVTTKK